MAKLRVLAALIGGLALAGCVHYREDWQFARDGSGVVLISCRQLTAGQLRDDSDATSPHVQPFFDAISQQCAQAGLRFEHGTALLERHGTWQYRARIWFPSLRAVAQCPLFRGRVLQWSAQRGRVRVLHVIREWPACVVGITPGIELFAQSAPVFEWRMRFPGRVISATGCRARGRSTQLVVPCERITSAPQISMLVVAHTRITWWEWLLWGAAALALIAAGTVIVCLLLHRCRRVPPVAPVTITYV